MGFSQYSIGYLKPLEEFRKTGYIEPGGAKRVILPADVGIVELRIAMPEKTPQQFERGGFYQEAHDKTSVSRY
jgi:hypothetical protein